MQTRQGPVSGPKSGSSAEQLVLYVVARRDRSTQRGNASQRLNGTVPVPPARRRWVDAFAEVLSLVSGASSWHRSWHSRFSMTISTRLWVLRRHRHRGDIADLSLKSSSPSLQPIVLAPIETKTAQPDRITPRSSSPSPSALPFARPRPPARPSRPSIHRSPGPRSDTSASPPSRCGNATDRSPVSALPGRP